MPAAQRHGHSQPAPIDARGAHGLLPKYGALVTLAAILYLGPAGFNTLPSVGTTPPLVGAVREPPLHGEPPLHVAAGYPLNPLHVQVREAGSITPTATPSCGAVLHRTGDISGSDPAFARPIEFPQGGGCDTGQFGVNYDYYEFLLTQPGPVAASLCAADGGSANYDSFLVIYQAAGGARRDPFQPNACVEAVAANDDFCDIQSRVGANLVAGYFYVVVTQYETGVGGAYDLAVLGLDPCPSATPTTTPLIATDTSTPTATRTSTATPTVTGTPTSTNTATPNPTPVLVVHVAWQGIPQPNSRNTTETVTATLRLSGGGPATEYTGYSTNANGYFTLPVGSLPNGTYLIRVKGPRNLSNGITACTDAATLAGGLVTNYEAGLMRAGDAASVGATNFNVVNATDFTTLKATFGKSYGQPGYDPRADFNNSDNVDALDFTLLKGNFGQSGCGPGLEPKYH